MISTSSHPFLRTVINIVIVGLMLVTSACGLLDRGGKYGPTLANLKKIKIEKDILPVPATTMAQLQDSYLAALEVAEDPQIRQKIQVRLADIEMAQSEHKQLEAVAQESYFADAVRMYQTLVDQTSAQIAEGDFDENNEAAKLKKTNERLLYQLSKAHALEGNMVASTAALSKLIALHPDSAFASEVEFRRAEQAFSQREYEKAEALYREVIAAGDSTPFYENALYMHGWSQFKLSRYRASIKPFTEVLDRTIVEGVDLSTLSASQRNLVADTLRVLSIVFTYLDGAKAISEVYANLGERHYQYLLYMNLGDLYLEKKRFRDSADTYRHYVQRFPSSEHSPAFSVKAIEVYGLGNFPSLILPAKEEYVTNYGIYSEFWKQGSPDLHAELKPNLYVYIDELASYYHATAQQLVLDNKKYEKLKNQGKKAGQKPKPSKPEFLKAAKFYQQFYLTFENDKKIPEILFLLGEAYFEADELSQAVSTYEHVAYELINPKYGPDAGYNAILALSDLVQQTQEPETRAAWVEHKINSQISFADYYSTDPRAMSVVTNAAEALFAQNNFKRAIVTAKRIIDMQPAPEKAYLKTAWLVTAHSQFDLKVYTEAEYAYRQVLSFIPPADPERKEISERVAASIYRSSEEKVAAKDLPAAVTQLLSITNVAPGSEVAISAQYDAANYLIQLKGWKQAENVLLSFKQRYPQHALSATLLPKFALIYQETKQWNKAAAVLADMAKSGDPNVRRQSTYLSAELYEKAGNKKKAIEQYRIYVNTYPSPFDIAMEARFKLTELYAATKQKDKRDYWLRELITSHQRAGSAKTERSKYLAAFATAKFAEDEYQKYKKVKLTLPLKKSLKKKKLALKTTLNAYKTVMDFGIAEFTTQANNRIGEVYAQLSRDLMDSPRPKGLDALALEQYEILLEEQAFPFEEKAIDLHAGNAQRAWEGIYDNWVKDSFKVLGKLLPARYGKSEKTKAFSDALY